MHVNAEKYNPVIVLYFIKKLSFSLEEIFKMQFLKKPGQTIFLHVGI